MVRIEHVAIYVRDLEGMRRFYEEYFGASSNDMYHNPRTGFSSYFLTFSDGCRVELMHNDAVPSRPDGELTGYHHLAFSVGSAQAVDAYTTRLTEAGFACISGPRTTGDGYYESLVLDRENIASKSLFKVGPRMGCDILGSKRVFRNLATFVAIRVWCEA